MSTQIDSAQATPWWGKYGFANEPVEPEYVVARRSYAETPRTNLAVFNGHKYLREESEKLETENSQLRAAIIEYVAASTVNSPPGRGQKAWDRLVELAK